MPTRGNPLLGYRFNELFGDMMGDVTAPEGLESVAPGTSVSLGNMGMAAGKGAAKGGLLGILGHAMTGLPIGPLVTPMVTRGAAKSIVAEPWSAAEEALSAQEGVTTPTANILGMVPGMLGAMALSAVNPVLGMIVGLLSNLGEPYISSHIQDMLDVFALMGPDPESDPLGIPGMLAGLGSIGIDPSDLGVGDTGVGDSSGPGGMEGFGGGSGIGGY